MPPAAAPIRRQRFWPHERVLVRYASDPVLLHARWLLAEVSPLGSRDQVFTALTPDRDVEELKLHLPRISEVRRYPGPALPAGLRQVIGPSASAEPPPEEPHRILLDFERFAGRRGSWSWLAAARPGSWSGALGADRIRS